MTPLAQVGYEVMQRAIQAGMGPERAWEAVAHAMARYVRESDRIAFNEHVRTKLGGSVER